MARVESQKTRQALLVVGEAMEVAPPPEKLELFLEDGSPVDVGKDRTRARWRGTWNDTAIYENNDFVLDDDKLYILDDFTLIEPSVRPSLSESGAWVLMTVSGMQFVGDWVPGPYKEQQVVIFDDALWVANEDIEVDPFVHVASAWDDYPGTGSGSVAIPVPVEAEVGDLMVWVGLVSSFTKRNRPADYEDWTELSSIGINDNPTPAAWVEMYGKIVETEDLGTTKTFALSGSDLAIAHLLVCRGSRLPVLSDVEYLRPAATHSMGIGVAVPAGADPASTTSADKVLRIFASYAQNFAFDSGVNPIWGAGLSGGSDRLLTDSHEVVGMGSYWATPGEANLPSYKWNSGEHQYNLRYTVTLPSPSGWDPTKWTQIGILAAAQELPDGGATGSVLAKNSAADGDVEWVPAPATNRRSLVKSTASLGAATDTGDPDTRLAGGGETGAWSIGPGVLLTNISVNRPCRVRLYTTNAKRIADVARDRFTDPEGDHGCLAEFLLISNLTLNNIPADYLFSGAGDADIYYNIQNYDLNAGVVTVTITVKDVEG